MVKRTLTQKILDFLKRGGSVKEARKKWPKKGATLTNAIQLYLEWVPPQIDDWQKKVGPLQSMNKRLDHEIRLNNREMINLNDKIAKKEKNSKIFNENPNFLTKR